jgi:flagellar basal-body rod protein FlgF
VALPPAERIDIGRDGTVSAKLLGQDNLVVLDRIKLVRPPGQDLIKGQDGLFRLRGGEEAQADASVTLVAGAIESSNVNSVESLVQMISLARLFEVQVKVMKEAESMDQSANQLLQPN